MMKTAQPTVGRKVFNQRPVTTWPSTTHVSGDKHRIIPAHAEGERKALSALPTVKIAGKNIME